MMNELIVFTRRGEYGELKISVIKPQEDQKPYLKIEQSANPNYNPDIIIINTQEEVNNLLSILLQYSKMIA